MQNGNTWPPDVSALDPLNDYTRQRHLAEKSLLNCSAYKTNNKYYEISTLYECVEKVINDLRCNIEMICLKLN